MQSGITAISGDMEIICLIKWLSELAFESKEGSSRRDATEGGEIADTEEK